MRALKHNARLASERGLPHSLLHLPEQASFQRNFHARPWPGFFCAKSAPYTVPMLWVKAFHIVFVTSWFAGLFYLPRIFVNLAMVTPGSVAERERLIGMSQRLLRFTTILAIPAIALGLWLLLGFGFWQAGGWVHAKLVLVVAAVAYHYSCGVLLRQLMAGTCQRSHRWFRWYNELPVLLLMAIVILVVVKPF